MSSNPRSTSKNTASNDPADELKRRSRRRLVGSVALFLTAIIVVPALVENEPVQEDTDVELVMPPRPSADPKVEFTQTQKEEQAQQADVIPPGPNPVHSEPTKLDKLEALPKPEKEAKAEDPDIVSEIKPEVKPEIKPKHEPKAVEPKGEAQIKTEVKVEPKHEEKGGQELPKPKVAPSDDPIAKFAQGGEMLWVQVTAVKDSSRAEQLKGALQGKGFSAKVEPVKTDQGVVYRVRVGPFAGQVKADEVQSALSKQGYAGRVVK